MEGRGIAGLLPCMTLTFTHRQGRVSIKKKATVVCEGHNVVEVC